jgi:uncharacterized zinc-type alcohol dehydrogenase-like protein
MLPVWRFFMGSALGYAAKSAKSELEAFSFQRREPRPADVVIDIKFCGICHSDIHQARDEWGGSIFPMVPGHEIAGVVTKVGGSVTKFKVGDRVGVGCFVDSCRTCSNCVKGEQQYCLQGMTGTYNSYERDGKTPTYGGYSNNIVVDENYVLRMPQNIPLDRGAPLLCAGITLYSPLRHWKCGPGMKVAVVGLGGLGHMGVKIASAMGAEVSVLSQSSKKQTDALKMGAKNFYVMSDESMFSKLAGKFDLIINTVSADINLSAYLSLLTTNGHMVLVGVPEKGMSIHPFPLIMGRRSLAGSLIGGIQETQEMLDFCGKHNIMPDIELIPFQKVNEAYERVIKSDVRYRFVLDTASLK